MSIFLEIMKEELERNLMSQAAFKEEINKFPSGYLSICVIDGKQYLYRKKREGNKIVSSYVGVVGDAQSIKAESDRREYLTLKQSLKELKQDEQRLRKAIKAYEKI